MLILLFLVLLVVTFSVVLFTTRPTKEETELGKRLAGYNRGSAADQVIDTDILKHEAYSDLPLVNALLRRMKLAANVDTLIKQANSNWTVGGLLFGRSRIGIFVGMLGGFYFRNCDPGSGPRSCRRQPARTSTSS